MELLNQPIVKGALAGLLSAAAVDIQAFRAFKSLNDLVAYSWGLAAFRWAQGAIVGALTAAGLGAI